MTLSEELSRLHELHRAGGLGDDEFARAKARLLDGPLADGRLPAAINAWRRSRSDRWLAGVCGGIAAATGVAAWFWRLLFAMLALCGGIGLLAYVLLWVFVPEG